MITAIDISSENGPNIHWGKVRDAGIEIVILRVVKDGLGEDPLCHVHARGARSAGLVVDAYAFTRPAKGAPEVQAQLARQIAEDIGAGGLSDDAELADGLSPAALAAWHRAFLTSSDRPENRTKLYLGPSFARNALKGHADFADRALWLCNYGEATPDVPPPWLAAALWQSHANTIAKLVAPFTWAGVTYAAGSQVWGASALAALALGPTRATLLASPGKVDGVPGEVDCNQLGPGVTIDTWLRGDALTVSPDLSSELGRQQALRALGHDPGRLDGAWGPASRAALVMVQRELAVGVDGTWGPKTEAAIRAALRVRGIAA
jgi:hypothetical protein